MIEKEDFIQIERLLSLTVMRKTDAALLQELMQKYVDKHCRVCNKCRGQIRFTQGRLRTWFTANKDNVVEEVEEIVLEDVLETVEETVEEIHPSQMDKRTKGYKQWFKSQQDESES